MDREHSRPRTARGSLPRRLGRWGAVLLRPITAVAGRLRPGPAPGSYLLRGMLAVAVVGLAMLAVLSMTAASGPLPDESPASVSASRVPAALPPVSVPIGAAAPLPSKRELSGRKPGSGQGGDTRHSAPAADGESEGRQAAFSRWAARMSRDTGIPARALEAYAHAHAVMAEVDPGCNVTWVTLAGIARIESNHGRYHGRSLTPDGTPTRPIIGVPLNGTAGTKRIADTDGGALDGDPVWDRAVGPFQFIPSTWARWASDGDGDGVGNPQDIDDAALAAARYLCAGAGDLSTGQDWLRAILSYNHSRVYANNVYQAARGYAEAAS